VFEVILADSDSFKLLLKFIPFHMNLVKRINEMPHFLLLAIKDIINIKFMHANLNAIIF